MGLLEKVDVVHRNLVESSRMSAAFQMRMLLHLKVNEIESHCCFRKTLRQCFSELDDLMKQCKNQHSLSTYDQEVKLQGIQESLQSIQPSTYLLAFVSHALELHRLSQITSPSASPSQLLDILYRKPENLLGKLIFQEKDYSKAEEFATYFNISAPVLAASALRAQILPAAERRSPPKESSYFEQSLLSQIKRSSPLLAAVTSILCSPFEITSEGHIHSSDCSLEYISFLGQQSSTLNAWCEEYKNGVRYLSSCIQQACQLEGTITHDKECLALVAQFADFEGRTFQGTFWKKLLDRLIKQQLFETALQLNDSYLEVKESEFVLEMLVDQTEDKSLVWWYLMRLPDREAAARKVLDLLIHWPVNICIDMLNLLKSHGNAGQLSPDTMKEVESRNYQILLYRDILSANPTWESWQALESECASNSVQMVEALLKRKHFDLARRAAEVFDVVSHGIVC